jgi:hypothetical protein
MFIYTVQYIFNTTPYTVVFIDCPRLLQYVHIYFVLKPVGYDITNVTDTFNTVRVFDKFCNKMRCLSNGKMQWCHNIQSVSLVTFHVFC